MAQKRQHKHSEPNHTIQKFEWSGPLPPPEILRQFGEIVPHADELILTEFKTQGKHRRKLEGRESRALAFTARIIALSIAIVPVLALLGGIFLILNNQGVYGTILVVPTVWNQFKSKL